MVDDLAQSTEKGTMQGGPLAPFLANILLDDLDKELEKRGLRFVRYADDFLVFTKSEAASKRVYESLGNYGLTWGESQGLVPRWGAIGIRRG